MREERRKEKNIRHRHIYHQSIMYLKMVTKPKDSSNEKNSYTIHQNPNYITQNYLTLPLCSTHACENKQNYSLTKETILALLLEDI